VEAARTLFYRRGFNATSYADIAEKAGIGKGHVQYYFSTKDDILKAVAEARVEGVRKVLEEWSLDCGTPYDCLERFVAMFEANAPDLALYGCPMGTLNDELGKTQPMLQEEAREMFDLFLRWLEARFRAVVDGDEARARAEFLMAQAQGISVLAHAYRDPDLIARQSRMVRAWLKEACKAS